MLRAAKFALLFFLLLPSPAPRAQSPQPTTRIARVSITGLRTLPPEPFLLVAALPPGANAAKDDLQAAADRLLQLGLFSRVTYEYRTFADGLSVTFHAEEAPRVPVLFDNMPTLDDSEINTALHADLPYFDGTAPETGSALDAIASSLRQFLQSRNINAAIEHQLVPNPLGDGALQQFRAIGADSRIASVEFSDALASTSPKLPADLSALLGKPYSRLAIQLFLAEKVRPLYLQHGFLRVHFATPQIRLAGPPAARLPDSLPVFIPITPGIAYRWQAAEWSGNAALSSTLLNERLGMTTGAVADGQAIDLAWERILDEYGRHGYVNAKLSPQAHYDDSSSTVSFHVAIEEENQYRHGDLLLTGLSVNGEAKVRAAWPIPPGEIFDKTKYDLFLGQLQSHSRAIFGNMPVNFDQVGHWLECHPENKTITVMLDFK
ncbi:MAG: hypothetical protein LAN71_10705 [Acidobacteriia bacterium]|nr:hypothetical protein [Terriglobia bacterium]